MRRRTGIRLATAVALTAMLGAAVSSPVAQAADRDPPGARAGTASGGIPALVDPAADLGAQPDGPEEGWADSIYFTSRVSSGGHNFGLLAHTVRLPNGPGNLMLFSVHDETTGWYNSYATRFDPGTYAWSGTNLDITAPGLRWTGNARRMNVSLTVPWGSLDVVLEARGPALIYSGTGVFSLFGQTNYEYAFPEMRTTGTLTVDGRRRHITGHSWLDRQWGPNDNGPGRRWTWMNFTMPNGDAIALWDVVDDNTGEKHTWATVQRKDGSYQVTPATPLARDAGRFWTSPTTGQRYPTRWTVTIPALGARLHVHVTGNPGQEIVLGGNGRLEATAAFEGTYRGARVSGKNYAEMFSDWQP